MGTSVLAGPASRDIAKSIAVALEARLVDVDLRIFPDGESKIRITGPMEGDDVIVVQSTHPPVDTHMMQLFFMLSRVSRIASRVIALVPYLGYARQDREFLAGEVVSMDTIARIISSYGIDALITVDAHSTLALSYFTIPVYNLSAVPLLAGYFKDRLRGEGVDADDVVSVSPDAGGAGRAEAFAGVIGCSHLALRKSRDRTTGSISIDHDMLKGISDHLRGKVAVVVDDMISTGSSVAEAVRALLEHGCRRVYVTCTHALMLDGALERIKGSGASAIVSTNTVPRGVGGLTVEVDVAPLAASALLSILMGRSGMDGMDREERGEGEEEGSKEGSKSISSV